MAVGVSACAAGGAAALPHARSIALVIDLPALHSQAPVDQPSAPAHMAPGQLPDATAQLLLLDVCQRHGAPLGIAVLTRQTAGTALGNPESILQNHDSSIAPRGALRSATTFRA